MYGAEIFQPGVSDDTGGTGNYWTEHSGYLLLYTLIRRAARRGDRENAPLGFGSRSRLPGDGRGGWQLQISFFDIHLHLKKKENAHA